MAIADAVSAVKAVVIEVHISNIARREVFRHTSFLALVCGVSIAGFGLDSYELALQALRLRNRRHS